MFSGILQGKQACVNADSFSDNSQYIERYNENAVFY